MLMQMKHSCVNLMHINTRSLKTCIYCLLVFPLFLLHSSPSYDHITGEQKTKKHLTLRLHGDVQGLTSSAILCSASSLAFYKERKHRRETTRQTQRNTSVCLCFTHEQSTFELDTDVKRSAAPLHRDKCRQNKVNMGQATEEGNLIALSSSSPLLSTPLMLLYIKAGRGR